MESRFHPGQQVVCIIRYPFRYSNRLLDFFDKLFGAPDPKLGEVCTIDNIEPDGYLLLEEYRNKHLGKLVTYHESHFSPLNGIDMVVAEERVEDIEVITVIQQEV